MPIPRPEHPRPDLRRDHWLSLNGPWEFAVDDRGSTDDPQMPDRDVRSIKVPFCPESALSGIRRTEFMECVWYRRSFVLPPHWRGLRVLMHFGAVDHTATVWVNGSVVGTHRGGYTPFSLDITSVLRDGPNEVVVRAVDRTLDPLQATGKQSNRPESYGCLYTRVTGIWQPVWLEAVGETHLRSVRLFADPGQASVTLTPRVDQPASGRQLRATARVKGRDVGTVTADLRPGAMIDLPVDERLLWEPESPHLYDLDIEIVEDDHVLDRVHSYFAFRTVGIESGAVLLNGRPVFQRLVLDQGYYPDGVYTAPDDPTLCRDIELAQSMGFNGARLHQKVFEPRFLHHADRLGYLLWGEYPNWGLDHTDVRCLPGVLQEWLDIIDRDANHPSIVCWCPFNETPPQQDSDLIRSIVRTIKALDPTRPVVDASGWTHVETDVWDVHDYAQDAAALAETVRSARIAAAGRPLIVSEYGGTWWDEHASQDEGWGYGERPGSTGELLDRLGSLTNALVTEPSVAGFCYTQLCDVEQERNGLLTEAREPKLDTESVRRILSAPSAAEAAWSSPEPRA